MIAPAGTPAEDKAIRSILKKVMDERKISQGWLASVYMSKYNCPLADQHKVSSWFRYKIPLGYMESFNEYAALWLRDNEKYIDEEAKEVIRLFLLWRDKRKTRSAVPSDYQLLLNAIKLYNGEDMESSTADDDSNPSIVDTLRKLQDRLHSSDTGNQMNEETSENSTATTPIIDDELLKFLGMNHIITIFDLHKFVFKELRRRKLSSSILFALTNMGDSNVSEQSLSNFLANRKSLDPSNGSLIIYHLIRWLMLSTKIPDPADPDREHETRVTSRPPPNMSRDKCPYCTSTPKDFSTSLGFSMHISWCRRRSNGQSNYSHANSSDLTAPRVDMDIVKEEVAFPQALMSEDISSQTVSTTAEASGDSSTNIPQHRLLDINQSNIVESESIAATEEQSASMIGSSFGQITSSPELPPNKRIKVDGDNPELPSATSLPTLARSESNNSNIGRATEPPYSEQAVIVADKFPVGSHYYACELCKRPEANLLCVSCPCSYHSKCAIAAFKVAETPVGTYVCGICE